MRMATRVAVLSADASLMYGGPTVNAFYAIVYHFRVSAPNTQAIKCK